MASPTYKQILTPANIVTTIRIAFIPVFVVVLLAPWTSWFPDVVLRSALEVAKPWIAAGVFALLAFTDSVDGYLARSRNQVTTLGKFLDPLADKILVSAALLALIELGELPAWVVLVIIAREFLVSGLRMVVSAEGHVIAASPLGKVKTVVQVIAVILFIIKSGDRLALWLGSLYIVFYVFCWVVMGVALLLTLLSMTEYFYRASKVLGLLFIKLKKSKEKESLGAQAESSAEHSQDDDSHKAAAVPDESESNRLQVALSAAAEQVFAAALQSKAKLASAESCTGGLIAKSLTDLAGSSEVFEGSVVSYSNQVKMASLDVKPETLECYGAVSEQTAEEMAQGALLALDVDYAVSTTGIAGPDGGSDAKPVGTVWIGVASKSAKNDGTIETSAQCFVFAGNRNLVRLQASEKALLLLAERIETA